MRKLALSDEILLKIEKPARYIGNEVNSVMKDKNEVDIRFAMCFPDVSEALKISSAKEQYIVLFCDLKYEMYGLDETKRNWKWKNDIVTKLNLLRKNGNLEWISFRIIKYKCKGYMFSFVERN